MLGEMINLELSFFPYIQTKNFMTKANTLKKLKLQFQEL